MPSRCIIFGCSNTTKDGVSLHTFPKNRAFRRKWTAKVKLTRARWQGPSETSVICSAHFEEDDFESGLHSLFGIKRLRLLKRSAIPTRIKGFAEAISSKKLQTRTSEKVRKRKQKTFSRARLKPRKVKENVLQPKSSHDGQLGMDLTFPMLIDDVWSSFEIAENLTIGDDSTQPEQTINAHVGANRIINSPLHLDHSYYELPAGVAIGMPDFPMHYSPKKTIMKTVGTQTDGGCFCNNIEKLPGRPKAKYEKKVLQSKIEVDMGKNQVQQRRKPSKKRENDLETSDSENKKDVVQPRRKPSKKRKIDLETSDSENKKDGVKPSPKVPKKSQKILQTPADSENSPLDVVKPGHRTPKRSKKIINTPSASENSPIDAVKPRPKAPKKRKKGRKKSRASKKCHEDAAMNSTRPRGSIRPISAWLENQGVAAETLQAVITGLGTEILGMLCARAQPTTARVQLCSLAAQTFTTTMYAELCNFMESCSAQQGSEQAIVSRCRKDVEEMGGSPGIPEIKVEYEDSFPEEKKDLKDDMYFGLSSSTGWR